MKPTLAQLRRLVGNPTAYALQWVRDDEAGYRPVREPVTDSLLQAHLDETVTVGTYIGHARADGASVARTLVFDFDKGYEESAGDVHAVTEALMELGIAPQYFGVEDSGRKGYHIWVVLAEYVFNHELRRVGRAACAIAGWQGEVNPKQDRVSDLGNLVKLPGGVHLVSGKQNNFLGQAPEAMPSYRWLEVLAGLPQEMHARRTVTFNRFPCMETIQEQGVPVGGRNDQLFHLATMLRRGGVSSDNVEMIVRKTNELQDPLEDWEVTNLLESSKNSGPVCSRLPENRRCGDLCVLERTSGLQTRPGAMRWAGAGERVVVEVVKHENTREVVITHDDGTGKVSLRPLEKK